MKKAPPLGDQTIAPGSALETNWLEILRGIRDHVPTRLWTAHWRRWTGALNQPTFADYVNLDNAYAGRLTYPPVLRAFNRPHPRPTFGTFDWIADSPLGSSGLREFTSPGDNGTASNDWVLVLETRGRKGALR